MHLEAIIRLKDSFVKGKLQCLAWSLFLQVEWVLSEVELEGSKRFWSSHRDLNKRRDTAFRIPTQIG